MVPAITTTLAITAAIVNVSVYHAIIGETDANPMQPADATVTYVDANLATEHHCAVSQDLLWFRGGPVHYGDLVVLDLPGMATYWRVSDTMHISVTQHVDLLVPDDVMGYWTGVPITISTGGEIDLYREVRQCVEAREGRREETCKALPSDCVSAGPCPVERRTYRRSRPRRPHDRTRCSPRADRRVQELRQAYVSAR